MRRLGIRISEFEYDLLMKHCRSRGISPSNFICDLVREHIIAAEPEYSDDFVIKISRRSRHSLRHVETVLKKYYGNWKMQAQALFQPSRSRLSLATCLNDIVNAKEVKILDPDISIAVASATGFRPMRIEQVIKRYPTNVELQVLEIFRALEPRIEPTGEVLLKIGNEHKRYPLKSLDDLAQRVQVDLLDIMPTEMDVASLTKLIEGADVIGKQQDTSISDWLKDEE